MNKLKSIPNVANISAMEVKWQSFKVLFITPEGYKFLPRNNSRELLFQTYLS